MNAARIVVVRIAIGILACLAIGLSPHAGAAQTSNELLPESEITPQKVKSLFDAAFIKSEVYKDDSVMIQEGGNKFFVKVDTKRKMLTYLSVWPVKMKFAETEKLEFVNALNKDLVWVRFYLHDPTTLVCDYQLSFENGASAFQIVAAYRMCNKVIQGAWMTKDPKDIVGRDKSEQPSGVSAPAPAPPPAAPLPAAPKADPSA